MASEVEAYLQARDAFRQHWTATQQVLGTIRSFASASNSNWKRILISGVDMPSEVRGPGSTPFDPFSWPTGEQIKNLILQWHKLDKQYRNLWEKVPETFRGGLTPPT
jgi:hypothetical protein